jgi:hypothetical protein
VSDNFTTPTCVTYANRQRRVGIVDSITHGQLHNVLKNNEKPVWHKACFNLDEDEW